MKPQNESITNLLLKGCGISKCVFACALPCACFAHRDREQQVATALHQQVGTALLPAKELLVLRGAS